MEGISGSGKSHAIHQIVSHLQAHNCSIYVYEWNSNHTLRALVRFLDSKKFLSANMYSVLQWVGFLYDYFFRIIPRLLRGSIVICDRYIYTGLVRDLANQANPRLGKIVSALVKKPDVVFFFNLSPEICHSRMNARGKKLFHTNKSILNSNGIKDKELFYLRRCRRIYYRILHHLSEQGMLDVRTLKEGNEDILLGVDAYFGHHPIFNQKAR
ncbi:MULTISPECIES: dTMP kinase [unclassified Paenibacillus]|uniref:dTMP kinase n=1 Tax=unclassified Paenibacillus TaxID=185978 RepID=UPI0030FD1BC7